MKYFLALCLLAALLFASGGCGGVSNAGSVAADSSAETQSAEPAATVTPKGSSDIPAETWYVPSTRSTTLEAVHISFDFRRMSTHASNQVAVWIENESGDVIKTLYVSNFTAARRGYTTRPDALSAWVAAAKPAAMSDTALDAISSATPSTGTQTFTWNLTDSAGNRVLDGVYHVKVEGTLYWSSNALYTAQIDTTKAVSGNIEVRETRSEPDNAENETMLGNVKVIAFSNDENAGGIESDKITGIV